MSRLCIAIGLLSLALLAFQLHLMQILSIIQWHHFGSMVVSVALLGFGAGGTILALFRARLLRHAAIAVPALMILCGVSMATAVPVAQLEGIRFDSLLLFVGWNELSKLAATYVILFLPLFFGALAIAVVFTRHVNDAGVLYFANLAGSGTGALLAVASMWYTPPATLPAIDAVFPLAGAVLMLPETRRTRWLGVLTTALGVVAFFTLAPTGLEVSQYKPLRRAMNLPDASVTDERFSPYGLVQVVESPGLRYAPGLSLSFGSPVPVVAGVFNNGDWLGPVPGPSLFARDGPLSSTTSALPYRMESRTTALILQSGTGEQVALAASEYVRTIDAVDIHGAALDAVLAADSTVFSLPNVRTHVEDPRSYLDADTARFDLIVLPTLGAFGGTVGLTALREQYLLTIEAFETMWDRLTPSGAISITAWTDYPARNTLRALATAVEMLRRSGVDNPAAHLLAVRSWSTVTYVATRSPLSRRDLEATRAFSDSMRFDILIGPDVGREERSRYNELRDSSLFALVDGILGPDRERIYDAYEFAVAPTDDDAPFFSQFLRWQGLGRLRDVFGAWSVPFLELGSLLAVVTLAQVSLGAFVLIILPLLLRAELGRGRARTLVYFGGLGCGFMLVEIVLMQRFILALGHPIYAAAFVIGSMLCFSGVGSLWSRRLTPSERTLRRGAFAVAAVLAAWSLALTPTLQAVLSCNVALRWAISAVVIGIPAFLMGMPFPLGLRFLGDHASGQIPWAWGINGSMSVVGAALAVIVSIETGFAVVMILAAVSYAIAGVACIGRGAARG